MDNKKWVEGFHGLAFGLVDGLITMLGVVIGVSQATGGNKTIVLVSGLVAGVANSFGNSIGFYGSELAERGEHMIEGKEPSSMTEVRRSTILSFLTSLGAMAVPMMPFAALSGLYALIVSVGLSLILLFFLGTIVGRLWHHHRPVTYGMMYMLMGVAGAGLSYLVGGIIRDLLTTSQSTLFLTPVPEY